MATPLMALCVATSLMAPVAHAATPDDYLRWIPSSSANVIGYVVHHGSVPGFFERGLGVAVDIGTGFELVDGVARRRLGDVVQQDAYVIMQAYDDRGLLSDASNEVYVSLDAPDCTVDADCRDADLCNGDERCQAGTCISGAPLSCADPGPCASAWCDPSTGCGSAPLPDGTPCDDADPTTLDDSCRSGICLGNAPPPEPDPGGGGLLFFDDFERYATQDDPAGWYDTGAGYSLLEDPTLFSVVADPDGGRSLGTTVTGWGAHSHYVTAESGDWWSYEYVGRMRFDDPAAGVGVTLLSGYPSADSYLSVHRHQGNESFHLAPEPYVASETCVGSTDTGVRSQPHVWYRFRFRVVDEDGSTRVRAKVWEDLEEEPLGWQIDCLWSAWSEPVGRPGVFSAGAGQKLWDDLAAYEVDASDGGLAPPWLFEDFEEHAVYEQPAGWLDTAPGSSLEPQPGLYRVLDAPGGGRAMAASDGETNVHSHYLAGGAAGWSDYEYSGRMLFTRRISAMGVTFYSDYPNSDRYLRLRRTLTSSEFHVANHPSVGAPVCRGVAGTGVPTQPNVWYAFRIQSRNEPGGTRIQAKVWEDAGAEPGSWQIDCLVDDPAAPVSGTPGLWSKSGGDKYWDDLEVRPLTD